VTSPRPALSLVLPCHDEEKLLPSTLDVVRDWLDASGLTYEVLVSDDSSTDRTPAIVRERMPAWPALRLVPPDPRRGKGAALTRGFAAAGGEYAAFIDADLEIPIENLGPLLAALDAGADIAIGSKRMKDDSLRRPLLRRLITGGYAAWVSLCLGSRVRDHQAGLKAMRLDRCRPVLGRVESTGWSWDTEFLVYAQQAGLAIEERGITTRVVDRASRVDVIRDSLRMGLDVLALRRRGVRVR